MLRVLVFVLMLVVSAVLVSCSDLSMSETGTGGIGGAAGTGGAEGIVDPDEKTRAIDLACTNNLTPTVTTRVPWELTVDPGPIVAGEAIGAVFRSRAVFSDAFFDLAQSAVPGGIDRVELLKLQATVHIREGATGPDVILESSSIERTCAYDSNGMTGVGAGPFPSCQQANDNPDDGSNSDCTGLGEAPSPDNPCGQFVTIPTSSDCAPDGECDTLDAGLGARNWQCETNGFCVAGSVEVPLEGSLVGYMAAASGDVVFGWDDQSTGATIQEGGPNDGTWILPPAIFAEPTGPNSIRAMVGDIPVALECTMGVNSQGPDGVDSRDRLSSPTPDWKLISFPIQTR